MPTLFIALQCCECSTMQVKQQKKSSNKWSCVVCNQKQSVRKVFAQAFMARDVRQFVQNFNMSRQLSDQKQFLSEEIETFNTPRDEQKRKRNDWTEYVGDQEEHCGKFDKDGDFAEGDDGVEPMVVTEMPKALSKKPKLNDYASNGYGAEKLVKPMFPNRRNAKRHEHFRSQDVQCAELDQTSRGTASKTNKHALRAEGNCSHEGPTALHPSERASKWNRFRAEIQDDYSNLAKKEESLLRQSTKGVKSSSNAVGEPTAKLLNTTAAKGPVSKWSSLTTKEDDDNLESRGRTDSWDRVSKRSSYQLESLMNDERVEDDIHPDFL